MLTIENFKHSVDLCNKRDALLEISKEINITINNPPQPLPAYKRMYIKTHAHNELIFFLCILGVVLTGTNCENITAKLSNTHNDEDGAILLFLLFAFIISPLLIAIIAKIIDKIILSIKGQPVFDKHKKEITDFYQNIQPNLLITRDKINQEIQSVVNELNSFDGIPASEWDIAAELWYLYSTHQADSYKEAVWLWRDIQHKIVMEQEAFEQSRLAEEAAKYAMESKEYAYEAMIESKRTREAAEIGVFLEAYNTYQISKLSD